MKKLLKFVGALVVLFVFLVAGLLAYVTKFLPNVAVKEDIKVEVTPERVKRGEYLANHVGVCMDCHSTRNWSAFSAPLVAGTLGVGGERFDQNMGFPGTFVAPNVTPHALASWSDGEIYRAITSGVSKDGRPMFPIMPYPAYGEMATEDVYSIIAYLRSLPPMVSSPELSKADFPVSVIMHTMPKPAQPLEEVPAKSDTVAYGAYLTKLAACTDCHTKAEKGKPVGEPFGGGFVFAMPGGAQLRSSNITPHLTTGIGAWSKEQFVARFKAFATGTYEPAAVDMMKGEMQTVMPWTMYAGMTEEDLGAIYDYLKTLKPAENPVQVWTTGAGG
ncbi:c-type cytochrome [Phragmitibacter flavus]|uniref:C-type cytochrome n=1 Tax=Phragmitibacter flavus TaxID=2576071 RepID=A0A5R8KJS3_9BACT|nr:c-type cytochrome [Phragmitibacter flavus]TLD72564.1 c-type cytochrome [Phragmitibacter flavus]